MLMYIYFVFLLEVMFWLIQSSTLFISIVMKVSCMKLAIFFGLIHNYGGPADSAQYTATTYRSLHWMIREFE
jgi:hypothetical protein